MREGGSGTYWLAGGTTLLDLMKLDVMAPAAMVDIRAVEQEHGRIKAGPTGLRLGAMVCMADAAAHEAILRDYPVIAETLQQAASAQLRNMATLGGNVLQGLVVATFGIQAYQPATSASPDPAAPRSTA